MQKLITEFPGNVLTVSCLNKLFRNWETLAVRERVKKADDLVVRALMTTLILSIFDQEDRPTPKSHRTTLQISRETGIRHTSVLYAVSFVRIWRRNVGRYVVRKKSLCKVCVAPNSRTKTATSFPNTRCELHIFHWWACVKASGRHFEHLIWSSFTGICVHFEVSD